MSQYQNGNAFSDRLRQLRGGRKKAEFARFLGIANAPTYQRYEDGRIPDAATLGDIASRCGKTVDWLLGREQMLEVESRTAKKNFSQGLAESYLIHDGVPLDIQIQTQLEGATLMAKRALAATPDRKDQFINGVLAYCGAMKRLLEEEPGKEAKEDIPK